MGPFRRAGGGWAAVCLCRAPDDPPRRPPPRLSPVHHPSQVHLGSALNTPKIIPPNPFRIEELIGRRVGVGEAARGLGGGEKVTAFRIALAANPTASMSSHRTMFKVGACVRGRWAWTGGRWMAAPCGGVRAWWTVDSEGPCVKNEPKQKLENSREGSPRIIDRKTTGS